MSRCIPTGAATITLGVDTHKDTHVGVALDGLGRFQGTLSVAANPAGYKRLVEWASEFGHLEHAGVEGTGSFGAGLARFLKAQEIKVFEVIRPKRRDQYRSGKSDPIDAEAAARAVLAGTATGEPKDADGEVEMIRTLRTTRRCAVKARAGAANQLQTLLVTAPEGLKSDLCGLSTARLVEKASRLRPGANPSNVEAATKFALRSVARRYQQLSEEISELDEQLDRLVTEAAPELVAVEGVGTDTAASLLIAAGDNPERLKDEAAFAHLCGAAPIPASSGQTIRHRLNRHGNRDANRALYVIAVCRMSRDERTRAYVAKRTAEGKSKKEIIRCLKRYIAREIYRILSSLPSRNSPISTP
ncbi:MAG TPA: IS110 family transposase [Rubrobacter sp.]|nr:IS110 family transposase [Rubrobacter sp.]